MQMLPLPQIFRAVEQNASTLVANSGTNTEIPDLAIPPKKRIAKTGERGIRRRFDDWIFPFGPGAKLRVGGGGQALHFAEGMRAVAQGGRFRRGGFDSSVDDACGTTIIDSTSCEASVCVSPAGRRRKCNWKMAPVNHVRTYCVRPVHVAPHSCIRVVLEKHVVHAVPENWAVGIVHPIFCGEQMELRAKGIGCEALLQVVATEKCE